MPGRSTSAFTDQSDIRLWHRNREASGGFQTPDLRQGVRKGEFDDERLALVTVRMASEPTTRVMVMPVEYTLVPMCYYSSALPVKSLVTDGIEQCPQHAEYCAGCLYSAQCFLYSAHTSTIEGPLATIVVPAAHS